MECKMLYKTMIAPVVVLETHETLLPYLEKLSGIVHVTLTAEDLGSPGYDRLYGYGAVQADKAVEMALAVGGGGAEQPQTQQLLANPGFDSSLDGWTFYPGDYIDEATWLSEYNGAQGVAVMYGTLPAWSFSVSDYAFLGQQVTFPEGIESATIEVKYYATLHPQVHPWTWS